MEQIKNIKYLTFVNMNRGNIFLSLYLSNLWDNGGGKNIEGILISKVGTLKPFGQRKEVGQYILKISKSIA